MKWLLLVALVSTTVHADERFAAHLGVSALADTFLYGFNKKALQMDPFTAKAFAAVETVFIGLLYKASENATAQETLKSTSENLVGIGAACITITMFDF